MAASDPAHRPVRASAAVTGIECALTRAAHLGTRMRQHERLTVRAGVPLDRAAVALLREIAEAEPSRPGELAQRLGVVAAHVTRQVTRLGRPAMSCGCRTPTTAAPGASGSPCPDGTPSTASMRRAPSGCGWPCRLAGGRTPVSGSAVPPDGRRLRLAWGRVSRRLRRALRSRRRTGHGSSAGAASRPVHASSPLTSAHASTPRGDGTASIGLVSPRMSSAE